MRLLARVMLALTLGCCLVRDAKVAPTLIPDVRTVVVYPPMCNPPSKERPVTESMSQNTQRITTLGIYQDLTVLRFDADVEEKPAAKIVEMLRAAAEHNKAIMLVLNTGGGDVDEGRFIARAIEHLRVPVYCLVDGEAASMGFYVLQACGRRWMTGGSRLMAHEAYVPEIVNANRFVLMDKVAFLTQMNDEMATHESKKMRVSKAEFNRRVERQDWWMLAPQALEAGAVDRVFDDVDAATRWAQTVR